MDIKALKKKVDVVGIIGSEITLIPQGGKFVACCPFHNEKTPSFTLDDRQGEWLWHCFGCNKGGDILRWFEMRHGLSTHDAIEKLEAIAGNKEWRQNAEKAKRALEPMDGTSFLPEDEKNQTFPIKAWAAKVKALEDCPEALAWLQEVRGLGRETAIRLQLGYQKSHPFKIRDDMEHCRNKGWILFPRILKDRIVAVKFRSIADKCFTQANKMDTHTLFNVETISPLEPVYLTEGELDACILEQAGFKAVSVMSAGAVISPQSRIELKTAERIFLSGDNDSGVGSDYMKKLQNELHQNTHIIKWPGCKDANDFFRGECNRDIELFHNRVLELAKEAKNTPPEGFKEIQKALREGEDSDLAKSQDRFHFPKNMPLCDAITYVSRGQILLLYSTYSGTGKTMAKTQLLLSEARRGEVIVDLSPEIRGQDYLNLVTSQLVGPTLEGGLRRTGKIEKRHQRAAADMLDRLTQAKTDLQFYIGHNIVGTSEEEVLEFIESTIQLTGATIFAIDTFHRLIFASGKTNQAQVEGAMAKKIELLAIKYNTIFLLIGQSNAEAEGLDNLKKDAHGVLRGCRELTDVCSAVYLLHRKRKLVSEGDAPTDLLENEAILKCTKSRGNGGGQQIVKLLLQPENSTFIEVDWKQGGDPGPQNTPESGFDSGEVY